MNKTYSPNTIESKWQKRWKTTGLYDTDISGGKKPFYNLMMFPYPSGEGLHVGHAYAFSGADIYGRYQMMRGHTVFEPMGYDAFGIHSENYAIKIGEHPAELTKKTTANYQRQLESLGNMYDWGRSLSTTDPEYYKWTQWLFVQLFKNGLAERKEAEVNWCPSCQTVLADEQVIAGECERCGTQVERKKLKQWFLKITKYQDRLLDNLKDLDWDARVKTAQEAWIGKSEGATIRFQVSDSRFQEKPLAIIAHGSPAEAGYIKPSTAHWFPHTKRELEKLGYEVIVPEFPIANKPVYADWKAELERKLEGRKIDSTTVAIGMSAGTSFLARFLADTKKKVNLLAMVAPSRIAKGKALRLQELYDFEPKKNVAEKVFVMYSTDDRVAVHQSAKFYSGFFDAETRVFSDRRHFTKQDGVTKLPELIDWIKLSARSYQLEAIDVFTTRPDTLYGATYMVLAPEHPLAQSAAGDSKEVADYVEAALNKTEQQRREEAGQKTGVDTGLMAINPATEKEIPIWIADYVLAGYGTGAIMAVPAHDDRDREFAEKFDLEIVEVVSSEGVLVNSGEFDGTAAEEARKKITEKFGTAKTTYRLRDWLISRQRYWGPPIPIIHCEKCGEVAVPEKDLPVELPHVEDFRPTGTGVSPLASVEEFVNVKCPDCGGDAKRETDVSDTFLDSSWYFLRYPSFDDEKKAFNPKTTKKWLPVDSYIGGAEHSVLHLLYSRFITMALKDMGHIDFEEPFSKFRAHGLLIKDGHKMSKSKGNVINPDEYIEQIGADAFRIYLMFLAPYEQGGDFRDEGIAGVVRFLNRVWNMTADVLRNDEVRKDEAVEKLLHKTIKKVTHDIENLHYNTAIAAMMTAINTLEKEAGAVSHKMLHDFIKLLAPIAPHFAEEIHEEIKKSEKRLSDKEIERLSIFKTQWPKFDEKLAKDDEITIGVMINGKVRDEITIASDEDEKSVIEKALNQEKVQKWLDGAEPKKTIYVKGKIVTFVI